MTAWHTEQEWKKFKEEGQALRDQRLCVLCLRKYAITLICTIRDQEGSSTNPIILKPNALFQQYRVKTNCLGGYYAEDVLTSPSQTGWEGMVGAMVVHRKHKLIEKTKIDTKQRWLDQSAIMYQPPKASTQPDLGELNRDFQDRSGLQPPGLDQLDAMLNYNNNNKQNKDAKEEDDDDEEAAAVKMEDDDGEEKKAPMLRKRRRMNKHREEELRYQRVEWLHNHAIRGPRLDLIMSHHCSSNQCGPLLLMSAEGALSQQNPVMSVSAWLHTLRRNPLFVRDNQQRMVEELQKPFSYAKGLVMDACLDIWCGRRKRILFERDLICSETLEDFLGLFLSFAFADMTKIPKETPRIRHLLMKAWPMRCWTRKFDTLTAKYIKKDAQCDNQLHRIVLCCLLGNYSWIQDKEEENGDSSSSRPINPRVRFQLHQVFEAGREQTLYRSDELIRFRLSLLKKSPQIHLHALQLYICSLVRSNSVIQEQAQRAFNYVGFEKRVIQVTNKIRAVVVAHFESIQHLKDLDVDKICGAVNHKTDDFKKSILDKSYERRTMEFLPYICSIRDQRDKYNPNETPLQTWTNLLRRTNPAALGDKPVIVFKEPAYIKPSTALGKHADAMMKKKDGGENSDEDDDVDNDAGSRMMDSVENLASRRIDFTKPNKRSLGKELAKDTSFVDQELALLKSGGVEPIPDDTSDKHLVVTKMDITVSHSKALEELLKRFDPNTCTSNDVFNALEPHLVTAFGCNQAAHKRLLEFQKEYTENARTKQYWEEQVRQLWTDFPYTYCLIRALGQLYVRHTKIKIHSLPPSMAMAQIRAIQSRTKEIIPHGDGVCLEEPLYLRMCFCCRYINTVFIPERTCSQRQAAHAMPGKACKRVMINMDDSSDDDSESDEEEKAKGCGIYCHNVYVYGHHRCDQKSLMEVGLLGKCLVMVEGYRLQERKRLFMLCCQKGCGQAMQADQLHTLWNDDGIACTACTSLFMQQAYEDCRKSYAFLDKIEEFACFLCEQGLSEKRGFSHWDGVKICKRCHKSKVPLNGLYDYVKSNLPIDQWAEASLGRGLADEALKQVILKYKALVAADRAPGDKKRNDMILKQLKRANVARKGGHS